MLYKFSMAIASPLKSKLVSSIFMWYYIAAVILSMVALTCEATVGMKRQFCWAVIAI